MLVTEEARRAGRSRSAVVEELAEEAAKMRLFPGVGYRGGPRRAWVIGSHARVLLVYGIGHSEFGLILRGIERWLELRPQQEVWLDFPAVVTREFAD